jgi:hypothetical protein
MNYLRMCAILTLSGVIFQGNVGATDNSQKQEKVPLPQCAQFCAHHVCEKLGVPLTLRQVCEMLPAKPGGENMLEIKRFLVEAGLECVGARITPSDIHGEQLPVIAHMITRTREGTLLPHWIVVQGVDTRQVRLLDGFGFQAVLSNENFTKDWDGCILRVTKPKKARRPAFAARLNTRDSWIQFDRLFIDAGDIPQSEAGYRFVFPFLNNGTEDLHILKVKPDCKCAIVKGGEGIIPPGARSDIVIQFTFDEYRGRFSKSALVQSDDPYFPFIELTMTGNGRQDVSIHPPRLSFGSVPQGKIATGVCFLTYKGNSLFEVASVESPSSNIEINIEPVSPDLLKTINPGASGILTTECQNRYVVSATIHTNRMNLGSQEYTVNVPTNLVSVPSLSIPVSFSVVSPITITPNRLFLGELCENSPVRTTIALRSEMGEDFVIDYVDVGNTLLECSYSRRPSSTHILDFAGVIKNAAQLNRTRIQIGLRIGESQAFVQREIPVSGLIHSAKMASDP